MRFWQLVNALYHGDAARLSTKCMQENGKQSLVLDILMRKLVLFVNLCWLVLGSDKFVGAYCHFLSFSGGDC